MTIRELIKELEKVAERCGDDRSVVVPGRNGDRQIDEVHEAGWVVEIRAS